jgi:cob(I)alamin adenosyltransferase
MRQESMMKIYTKTGDAGQTGLFGGPRVAKDDLRIEAYGAVDELNAALGVVRAATPPAIIDEVLRRMQHELFVIGAQLATPKPAEKGVPMISDVHIAAAERDIDHFEERLPPLKEFILPSGTAVAAQIHLARAICRRAERRVVTFSHSAADSVTPTLLAYLNRLGDLLFVLARAANQHAGRNETAWRKDEL